MLIDIKWNPFILISSIIEICVRDYSWFTGNIKTLLSDNLRGVEDETMSVGRAISA